MADKVQRVRGTQDFYGEDIARFDHVVETFNRVRKLYGFRRVDVPVFEHTSVFSRSLGETTDVVSKEMYSFDDRGGDSLTLRPEFTAGIARAYIQNGWQQHAPMKLAAYGPLFRYERPQKGRYRQFHQLDAEIIGAGEPAADVEVIAMGQQLLNELGISDGVTLQLNTMGDPATRAAWSAAVREHFAAHAGDLSHDSQQRLATNPLRILDSKDAGDKALVATAPDIMEFMTPEAEAFFAALTAGLDSAGVAWERNARLVRGLDYYRHSVFEFVTDRLGAQGTVMGGGRYDGLIGSMGGPETPAVGWAAGIERLAMLVAEPVIDSTTVAIVIDDDDVAATAVGLARQLRLRGIATEVYSEGAPKKRFDKARRSDPWSILTLNARPVDDRNIGTIRFKRFRNGIESENRVKADTFAEALESVLVLDRPFSALDRGAEVDFRMRQ